MGQRGPCGLCLAQGRVTVGTGPDPLISRDFDAGERAKRVADATRIREDIAEDYAALLAHAAREGWGKPVGLPVLSGDVLVYHFEPSGKRGIVRLPSNTDYGNKDT